MRTARTRSLVLTGALAAAAACATKPEAARRLDEYTASLADAGHFSGVLLAAEDGRVVFERAEGAADFAAGRPNVPGELFPIASISKLLTGTAILQLAQAGRLSIGDPAAKYLPGFPYPSITIRHLLSHTSGLRPYNAYFDSLALADPGRVLSNRDFLPRMQADPVPLRYRPGTSGNYDNINYIVLAEVVRAVTGVPYRDYIRRHVLDPAGMDHTSYHPSLLFGDSVPSFAEPEIYPHLYSPEPVAARTIRYAVGYWHTYQFGGFSGYVSTVGDLLRFDRALRAGKLLSPGTMRGAYSPVRLEDGTVNRARFGLGWEVAVDSSMGTIVYHSGDATGLSCVLLRNLTKDQTVIAFDNAHYTAFELGMNARRILNGRAVPQPKRSLARVYGIVLAARGPGAARDTLERLKPDTARYELSEDELNLLGYDFLGQNESATYHLPVNPRVAYALAALELNTELYPGSWNVWDSYGEALLAAGRREEAVAMYRRSLALNPKNDNGRRLLDSLGVGAGAGAPLRAGQSAARFGAPR